MRILGIDPGTRMAGYGIVEVSQQGIRGVAAGAWNLDGKLPLAARLASLAVEFRRIVDAFGPSHLCLELAFLAENARSALFLGHARGVVLSEAHQRGLVISEISATSAKKMITNYGRADKASVARMIAELLKLNIEKLPFDATDALGIAYAEALRLRQAEMQEKHMQEMSPAQQVLFREWTAAKKKKRKTNKSGFEQLVKLKSPA